MHLRIAALGLLLLASCSAPRPVPLELADDDTAPVADILLLGEQHDAASHQETHRRVVQALAARSRLAALALEMAEQGGSTAGLPPDASETAVRNALHWDDSAWPWPAYGPAVMAAVGAGVPVIGANLPRAAMRTAMADEQLDGLLPGPALKAQQQAIRLGHCNQLPESQIRPMTRIQLARDRGMAQTLAAAVTPGKTVVLLAGAGHVDETIGIPRYVDASVKLRSVTLPPQAPARDYCAQLERQLKR
jgi:uncharacterized iron-regulated protein